MTQNLRAGLAFAFDNRRNPANPDGRWKGKCQSFARQVCGVVPVGDAIDVLNWAIQNSALHGNRFDSAPGSVHLFGGNTAARTHIAVSLGGSVCLGTSSPRPWDGYDSVGVFDVQEYVNASGLPYRGYTNYMRGISLLVGGPLYFRDWQGGILRSYGYRGPADNLPAKNTYMAIQRAAIGYRGPDDGHPGFNTWQGWQKRIGWK